MQVIDKNEIGIINKASNDDGSIQYWPIGNDRLIVNGRGVYQREYLNDSCKMSGELVAEDLWTQARELQDAVDDHNRRVLDDARDGHFAHRDAEAQAIADSLKGTRGTYTDPNTF